MKEETTVGVEVGLGEETTVGIAVGMKEEKLKTRTL